MKKVNELIPCNTDHVAVFSDGSSKEVIGWASKNGTEKINGDIEQASYISGLVVNGDEIVFADDMSEFEEYKSESDCEKAVL